MFRTLTTRQLVVDIVIGVVFWVLAGLFVLHPGSASLDVVVALGMSSAVALRRLSPALALIIAWAFALLQVLAFLDPVPSNLAVLAVLYATAAYGSPVLKWLGLASAGVGALVASSYLALTSTLFGLIGVDGFVLRELFDRLPAALAQFVGVFLTLAAIFFLSWTLGLLARSWRTSREAAEARTVAEREREQTQRLVTVEQERNRIARDMHDVVAHSLAVVIAQADGARYAARTDPEVADAALATISTTAREALGDVRILLTQLRHSQGEAPQPVLADLDRLLEQFRASGLPVTFVERGENAVAPAGTQLAIYRIVQEALTNALRHGDRDRGATVTIQWSADAVEVTVANARLDSDTVLEPESHGHGLPGMTERAHLAGGSLSVDADEDRFVVRAALPTTHERVAAENGGVA